MLQHVVAADGYLEPRQVHGVEEPIYHELEFPPKPRMEKRSLKQLATYANEPKSIHFHLKRVIQ